MLAFENPWEWRGQKRRRSDWDTGIEGIKIVDGSRKQTGRGLKRIPRKYNKSQDSSVQRSATSQSIFLDPEEGESKKRKRHLLSSRETIFGASVASKLKTPQSGSSKHSDRRVIHSVSQASTSKQSEIDFLDKKQPELEVKILEEPTVPGETTNTSIDTDTSSSHTSIPEVLPKHSAETFATHADTASAPGEIANISVEIDIPQTLTSTTEVSSRFSVVTSTANADTTSLPGETNTTPGSKRLEILKSVVFGGLTESLARLSIVTSAASVGATTSNIVTMAIANLIGGLFPLGHNLRELKSDQPIRSSTNVTVDKYNELLGQRGNFFLHAFSAILSFIVFGLVPPIVYGFSFHESDEKDFKLSAVGGAYVLCITLLSIGKAYTKRPNSFLTYFQTVIYYVSIGTVASVLPYLAGDMVKKFIERHGWFEPAASNFAMRIPESSVQQPGRGSY